MADNTVTIEQLPPTVSLDGTERVPIAVPDGLGGYTTQQTTTGSIASVGVDAEYVLVSSNPLLPNSRILAGSAGEITLADGGAGENLTIGLASSGVSPGTYGDDTHTVQVTVDGVGRVTSISAIGIAHQGTVTSVGLTAPVQFDVSGSPVTDSGTLALTWANASTNFFLAGPASGAAAAPGFRAIVAGDLPASGATAGTYGDGTHVAQLTVDVAGRVTSASQVAISHQGTVTSVALALPSDFAVTGSPVTSTGTLTGAWATTPTGTGAMVRATSPTLVTPDLGTPSAIDLTNATGLPLTSGVTGVLPVANGGTGAATAPANEVFAGPASGSAAAPGMRALVLADLPVVPTVSVATRAALAAVSSSVGTAYITEAGRGGMFQWSSADQSALVAADPLQGVCVPPLSDPTGASGAWIRPEYTQNQWVNLTWFGATAGGADTTSAFNGCLAVLALTRGTVGGGTIYVPTGSWFGNWVLPQGSALNITIRGVANSLGSANYSSWLFRFSTGSPALSVIGNNTSSGTIEKNFKLYDLYVGGIVAGVPGLDIMQCANVHLENVTVISYCRIIGTLGTAINCYFFSNQAGDPGLLFTNTNGVIAMQNNGPFTMIGGQTTLQGTSGTSTGKGLQIAEDSLSLTFIGVELYGIDGPVQIDGGGSATGSITFIECHTESASTDALTGANFLIGSVTKYGSVKIIGGNYWGQGNGTKYLQDWVRIVDANNVTLDSSVVSKLAATHGFSRSAVRIESTFTGKVEVRNVNATGIEGSMYSDATGKIPAGYVGDVSNNNQWWDGVTSSTNYTQLPGGMQMCWGTATVGSSYTAITFPRAFSSTTGLVVTATPLGAGSNAAASPVTSITTTGFACASNLATTVTWMAIGPANP